MAANSIKQFSKLFFITLTLIWISSSQALPLAASDDDMVHNDNYEMIMPDDHEPAETMPLQNFEEFYKADDNDGMSEMEMDESRTYTFGAQQLWNVGETALWSPYGQAVAQREKRVRRSLAKGATWPHEFYQNVSVKKY